MKCYISCSFGEIVDKVSILKIKSKKSTDKTALKNIQLELDTILKETPLANEEDSLFTDLYKINNKLWVLEDLIREKSNKKEFDDDYIRFAEDIHKTNDKRYKVKRQINDKYGSELKEEKIYKKKETHPVPNQNDLQLLEKGKHNFTLGNYSKSYTELHSLTEKFKNYPEFDNFYVELLFSYSNIISIFNYPNEYAKKIDTLMGKIDVLNISAQLTEFCKQIYVTNQLRCKKYSSVFKYINRINNVKGPNVSYDTMSFFDSDSTGKTLLIYEGGGLGDYFMFSRFIPKLCNSYKDNPIVFFVVDSVSWIVRELFAEFQNLTIITHSESYKMPTFHHHCSLIYLMKVFQIQYENLTFEPMMTNLTEKKTIYRLHYEDKQTYIFNWKGNSKNSHEIHNRRMELGFAIPLFRLKHIHWVVITKNITPAERKILDIHGVTFLGDMLDNGNNCFEDSIGIIKNVKGVISTDTSIIHLSANLGVPTTVLLTTGCEWRWTNDQTTNWYPDMTIVRQEKQGDWKPVIENVIATLSE